MNNTYPSSSIYRTISLVTVVIFAAFFQISCSGVITALDQYSGETLYDSAIESNGDLLAFAPEIQSEVDKYLETDEERRQFQAFQKELVAKLINENPDFVEEFREKLKSNDRDKINEALSDAGALLEEELQAFTGESEITAENVVNTVIDENSGMQ